MTKTYILNLMNNHNIEQKFNNKRFRKYENEISKEEINLSRYFVYERIKLINKLKKIDKISDFIACIMQSYLYGFMCDNGGKLLSKIKKSDHKKLFSDTKIYHYVSGNHIFLSMDNIDLIKDKIIFSDKDMKIVIENTFGVYFDTYDDTIVYNKLCIRFSFSTPENKKMLYREQLVDKLKK